MSTLSERWRNTSTVARVLLLVLLVVLLVLLCLLIFLQFVLPILRPTEMPTTLVTTTITPTRTAPATEVPPTDTPVPPTNTPVVTTGPPGVTTETPAEPSPTATAISEPSPTATATSEPSPTAAATAEPSPTAAPPLAAQATATPTRVVADAEPSPTPRPTATAAVLVVEEIIVEPVVGERIRNGDFEDGFEKQMVGQGWTSFNNGAAVFEFLEETWAPAVFDGERAQRIQVREASQPDRYAGIYQTVSVVPGETYNLTLNGQIRSGEGDIQASQYGYRMQLGIDEGGGQDWTAVEDWVELPWDEQRFDSDLFFYDYSTPVVATDSRLTIFIRSWNKWPDPGRVEYTVDAISLTGLIPSEEVAVDKALPVTGNSPLSVGGRLRLLASAVLLCLLVADAVWQVRRQFG